MRSRLALVLASAIVLLGCTSAPPGPDRFALEARGVPPPAEAVKIADSRDNASAWVSYRFANDTSIPTLTSTWAREVNKVGWTDINSTVHADVGTILASKKDVALKVWIAHSNETACCTQADTSAASSVMAILVVSAAK